MILYGNAVIKPDSNNDLYYEYTPLNNKYIYLDGSENTYIELSESCKLEQIYSIGNFGGST